MANDLTVIYYTSNTEIPTLEANVIATLLDNIGDTPLISVSQKPMGLGKNICVGDVGISGHNAWRQLQIGALEATTTWICPAESDVLHPKEFFQFRPRRRSRFYIAMPLYVLFAQRGYKKYYARKLRGSEATMMVGRDFLLRRMDEMFAGLDQWGPVTEEISILHRQPHEYFHLETPLVTFKTDRNMHKRTPHKTDDRIMELPHWGEAHNLIQRYVYENGSGQG